MNTETAQNGDVRRDRRWVVVLLLAFATLVTLNGFVIWGATDDFTYMVTALQGALTLISLLMSVYIADGIVGK